MPTNDLVSVIIPVYNDSKRLGRAIDSVIMQTYQNWEIIVIDDGSSDKPENVVEKYAKKYPVKIFHQTNKGQGAARNLGCKKAKGERLAFLDSDDLWHPNKLEKQLKKMSKDQTQFSCTNAEIIFPESKTQTFFENLTPNPNPENIYESLIYSNFIICSSVVVSKEIFTQAGGFNEKALFRRIEDLDLWLRIARMSDGMAVVNYPLTLYTHPQPGSYTDHDIARGMIRIYARELVMANYQHKPLLWKRLKDYLRLARTKDAL